MEPFTEHEIRAAFVNRTKGEAKRLFVPHDLAAMPWPDLDFLGWRDPRSPDRAYLAADVGGQAMAVALRSPRSLPGQTRRSRCSMCLTTHSGGVSLMVAPKAGRAGANGNSVGTYICGDLCCSLYIRGKKDAGMGSRLHETISLAEKVQRTTANLAAFLTKVTGDR